MGKDRAKRCGDREIICFQLSTLSLIRTEKSLVYFKSPLWKRKRKALSASAMLIRIEQTVWQKRHNVLNLVWHLKGLTIIIFLPPLPSRFELWDFCPSVSSSTLALKWKVPSFERWFMRVPLTLIRSLHDAVASLWGVCGGEFHVTSFIRATASACATLMSVWR